MNVQCLTATSGKQPNPLNTWHHSCRKSRGCRSAVLEKMAVPCRRPRKSLGRLQALGAGFVSAESRTNVLDANQTVPRTGCSKPTRVAVLGGSQKPARPTL